MGTLKVNGELDINSYLSATSTLYISSAANCSVVIRNNTTGFINMNTTSSSGRTSAGNINALRLYGTAYGNDANYLATSGKLSIGDPGPQIIFNTSPNLTEGQPLALIYSSHDTIAAGNSLSLVSSEDNCTFIAPTIRALTKFVGALNGNATTATKLKTARTISLTGSVTGSGTFDGSGNLSIATTTNHTHSYLPLSGGTLTGGLTGTYAVMSKYISIGTAIGYQNSDRAELHIVSSSDKPMDLWMGTNQAPQWSLSVRDSSDSNVFSIYNKSGGHLLRIYTNGMIKLNKGANQYGSTLPSGLGTGDKGCIFFKT